MMGGLGSGRRWSSGRVLVEDGLVLDINKLMRDGIISPGARRSGSLVWRRVPNGEQIASVSYSANAHDPEDARLHLTYRVNGDPQDYGIDLETTRPNFGGDRWWMICPATGRRVAKLYLPNGGKIFASRQAYGLAYRSQRERAHERALTQAQNIRTNLGGSSSLFEPFPPRPKGMWQRTYRRLRLEGLDAEWRSWEGVGRRLGIEI